MCAASKVCSPACLWNGVSEADHYSGVCDCLGVTQPVISSLESLKQESGKLGASVDWTLPHSNS